RHSWRRVISAIRWISCANRRICSSGSGTVSTTREFRDRFIREGVPARRRCGLTYAQGARARPRVAAASWFGLQWLVIHGGRERSPASLTPDRKQSPLHHTVGNFVTRARV